MSIITRGLERVGLNWYLREGRKDVGNESLRVISRQRLAWCSRYSSLI